MKVKTYRILTDDEFDRLVKATYGEHVKYEFVAAEEAHNYTSVTFNNMVPMPISSYDFGKLQSLRNGGWEGFMAQTLIQDMVNNSVLDPGNYMVEVFW